MNQRKPFFGANWKMHKNLKEAKEFFNQASHLNWSSQIETVFFPPFHLLISLKELVKNRFLLGAQNCFHEDQGAFTGEISSWMLKEEGFSYVIIGHSERRILFQEKNEVIRKKLEQSLKNGLKVILCIGETLQEREANKHFEVIETQLKQNLKEISIPCAKDLIIAYEPVWAIGTGKTASPEQAQEIHAFIRSKLAELEFPASQIRIIYGGSVKPENIKEIMTQNDIDGALVGGASLKPDLFNQIASCSGQ